MNQATNKDKTLPFGLIDMLIDSVQNRVDQQFVSQFEECNELIHHFRSNHGKMIRSKLLLLSAGACGLIRDEHVLAASIFHIIHEATLFHDDVIDKGKLRRGKTTLNECRGNKTAVLAGDILLSHALKMSLQLPSEAMSIIADMIIRICEGEIKQDLAPAMREPEYLVVIRLKSAEMFAQSCYLGAFLAGADERVCRKLQNYGLFAGMAYQISDDLSDICGNDMQLGKSSGRDINGQIETLPIIHFLQQGGERELLYSLNRRERIKLLSESGSLDYCHSKIDTFCSQAIEQLQTLAQSDYKYSLNAVALSIVSNSLVHPA